MRLTFLLLFHHLLQEAACPPLKHSSPSIPHKKYGCALRVSVSKATVPEMAMFGRELHTRDSLAVWQGALYHSQILGNDVSVVIHE